ncbi:hypothetical protein [Reyranella sp.]|uniref:hypothetical protein n=1 Tax=Reyranella sp. TaxID=1929291 RepID=UPI002F93F1C3
MRRIQPFVLGHVGGALLAGAIAGTFFDAIAVVTFAVILAGNALIATLVCWWRPGLGAAGWKLWLMASLANPLMLAGCGWSGLQYECLIGDRTGWDCLFADVGPFATGMALLPPVLGVAARWLWRFGRVF